MYNIPFILSVFVKFSLILSAKGNGDANGQNEVIYDIKSNQNVTLNDNEKFHFRITENIAGDIIQESCIVKCNINDTHNIGANKCNVVQNQWPHIDVIAERNVTKQDAGKWNCEFTLRKRKFDENRTEINPDPTTERCNFIIYIKTKESPGVTLNWIAIAIGIGIMVTIIIIMQTICIIHFRKKAKVVKRQARWTSMTSSAVDPDKTGNVRYSKMPVPKSKVEGCTEARESGIYEALENVRDAAPAPVPPPLKTLPRKDMSHNSTPPLQSPTAESTTRTFTNGMLLPFTNSLLRNKSKKAKEFKEPENKRTTIDRIKERDPYPLPEPEEVYEAMENSPEPPRKEFMKKEFKRNEIQKKEEFRNFNTAPKAKFLPPGPGQVNLGTGAQSLQAQVLPSQLKEALRKRVNTVMLETQKPRNLPLRAAPASPGPLTVAPSKSALAPPVPRSLKSVPTTPVASAPRIKPPPPVKPKQLHPLPPTPTCRPESIPVITERRGDDDDEDNSDEDWTYEPLPQYPIYSI